MNKLLAGLAAEARKAGSWENFHDDFLSQIKHGTYWHVTSDPRFAINPKLGPRDMSSMADSSSAAPGKLMVTSDLEFWAEFYSETRKFAALVDMSSVPRSEYWQVKRGMGNEFWVEDPSKAKVIKVMRINDALLVDEKFHNALPGSNEELHAFYDEAVSRKNPSWLKVKDEERWRRAKEIAAKQRRYDSVSQLHDGDWALVTHILSGMHGQTSVARKNPGPVSSPLAAAGQHLDGAMNSISEAIAAREIGIDDELVEEGAVITGAQARIQEMRRFAEERNNPGFSADDMEWDESPPPAKKTPVEEAMVLLSSMRLGDVVRIGNSTWEVCEPRRDGSVTVYFRKAGTKGSKFYTVLPNENGDLCVFLAGGSGQRAGPDVAMGHAVIAKARNNPSGATAFDDAAEIMSRPRNNPGIDDNSIAGLADRIQASFLLRRFAAKEVLAWRDGPMVTVAFRGDAIAMELQLFSDERVMMENRHNSLDAEIQRLMGIKVEPSSYGISSVLGQTMSDDDAHISDVMDSIGKAASYVLDPASMDDGVESVRVTLMPMEGTPWVKGSEKTRWYNAKTKKWTESGKPAGLTEVEVRGGSSEPETVKRTAMDFCTVVERIGATGAKYAAARHGDQTFLVSHSIGFPAHGPGAEKIAEFWNRCGGILFPSVSVGNIPASNFGPVAFILDPIVILAGMKPYHSRGRWPVVTYSSDAWTETTNQFFSDAAVTLFRQMTGNWRISIYGTPHFYILGPVVENGSRAVKISIINNTAKLASAMKTRAKKWPREMSSENLEEMRGRSDQTHYPYLESKVNGVLSLDCVHTVVAPKELRKVLTGFLKSVGYKGAVRFIDVDDYAGLEAGDLKPCYDYAWKVRDLILKDAPVMNVE